jgi:adenylate cyclase
MYIGTGNVIEWLSGLLPVRPPRGGSLAFMFTDIAGFTRYAAAEGDGAAVALLRRHDAAIVPAVRAWKGRIVKRLGDGLMIVFDSPVDAVEAALDMQRAAARRRGLRLRIGIHAGAARVRDGDLIGHDVNVAARIGARARGGAILVSERVRCALDGRPITFSKKRPLHLDPRPAIDVYRVTEPCCPRPPRGRSARSPRARNARRSRSVSRAVY